MTAAPRPAADREQLAALGRELTAGGLTARGLLHLFGTQTLARLPARLVTRPQPPLHRVTALLELLVAGRAVPAELAPAGARPLVELGLVEERGGELRARCAILPIAPLGAAARGERDALAVCDRWDAPLGRDATPWPDDSSHHLAGALGGTRASRWLDLGTGSGIAPLARRGVAPMVLGVDVVPATARAAALGAALSDHRRFAVAVSDLDDAVAGQWDLLTCNAPIPDEPAAPSGREGREGRAALATLTTVDGEPAELSAVATSGPDAPRWRHAAPDFLIRLCQRIPSRLRRGGLAILHAHHDALERALAALAAGAGSLGDAVTVVYTPPGTPAFGVTWWQPHLPARRVVAHRALTAARPHVDERDRIEAEAAAAR